MTDTKNLIRNWSGCDPAVLAGVELFRERQGSYSKASRRYSIYRLVRETLDKPFADFFSMFSAVFKGAGLSVLLDTPLSICLKTIGFKEFDLLLSVACSNFYEKMYPFVSEDDFDLLSGTLDVLRDVSKALTVLDFVRDRAAVRKVHQIRPVLCACCGRLTEYSEYLAANNISSSSGVVRADLSDGRKLSRKYCKEHRSRNNYVGDGGDKWNSSYRRARRSMLKFEVEERRFEMLSVRMCGAGDVSGDAAVDFYLRCVIGDDIFYLDEQGVIRNGARSLVDFRISDRKKVILALFCEGWSQSAIAKILNISRQAVSQTLKRIPDKFRITKKRDE